MRKKIEAFYYKNVILSAWKKNYSHSFSMLKSLHVVTQVCLHSNSKIALSLAVTYELFSTFSLDLRLKVRWIGLVNLTWQWPRIGLKFLEGISVQPGLEWRVLHEHKSFAENPLQAPCLSFCESRLHSFLSWTFPMLFKSLQLVSKGSIHPRRQLAEIQGNMVLHILQYKHLLKFFILGKFKISGFFSWLKCLTLPYLHLDVSAADICFLANYRGTLSSKVSSAQAEHKGRSHQMV